MAKAPNTMVIVRNIFMKTLGHSLRKRQRPSDHSRPLVKEDEEHEQHWLCANALLMEEVIKPRLLDLKSWFRDFLKSEGAY